MTNHTTTTTDHRWHIVSPLESAIYELPPHFSAVEAETWLAVRQEAESLSWACVLLYGTEAEARDLLAGLQATTPDRPRWNA